MRGRQPRRGLIVARRRPFQALSSSEGPAQVPLRLRVLVDERLELGEGLVDVLIGHDVRVDALADAAR